MEKKSQVSVEVSTNEALKYLTTECYYQEENLFALGKAGQDEVMALSAGILQEAINNPSFYSYILEHPLHILVFFGGSIEITFVTSDRVDFVMKDIDGEPLVNGHTNRFENLQQVN